MQRSRKPPRRRSTLLPMQRQGPKVHNADPCPCGSGLTWKKCCQPREKEEVRVALCKKWEALRVEQQKKDMLALGTKIAEKN